MIRLLPILIALICFVPAPAFAALEGGSGDTPEPYIPDPGGFTNNPSDSGSCSWQSFKEALGARESSGNYCAKNQYGYLGKYQLGKAALQDIGYRYGDGSWTGKNGVYSESDWLCNAAVQEAAMEEWTALMNRDIENAGLDKYIGQTIGGCVVTKSGLLAGRHLKGIGNSSHPGLKAWLESGGAIDPVDGNGTPVSHYVCKFKGYYTPFDNGASQMRECGGGGGGSSGGGGGSGNYPGTPGAGHTPGSDIDGDGGYQPRDRVEKLRQGIRENWIAGLMLMAEQFTANMAAQAEAIGHLLDAKHQLETQRLFQQKTAEAHKDYHPSEQMCTFGTFARDLLATERHANLTREALSKENLQRDLGTGDSKGMVGTSDFLSRLSQFRKTFCEPGDNSNGLQYLCPEPGDEEMRNRDINYTRTLDMPLSLEIDLTDDETTPDETAVFALIDNLFLHKPMPRIPETALEQKKFQYAYHNARSLVAMRGIARNSFANLIALKTAAAPNETPSGPYFKALMKEFGLPDEEVEKLLGENPSYYAQMELLTKKIYQNPSFYANLYDKPANVERIRAAMRAIKLMNDRDIHAALLRREMLLSMILELRLREKAASVYNDTEKALFGEE